MIWFEIVYKFVENGLDYVWKFVGNLCNTSLNKSSRNNWVAMKRTNMCQLLLPSGYLVDTSQILSYCPADAPT